MRHYLKNEQTMHQSSRSVSIKHRLFFSFRRLQIILPYYFAHHPLCEDYSQEVISSGQWVICRGCAFTYTSLLIFAISDLVFQPFQKLNLYEGIFLSLLITSPVWIGLFYSFQSRIIKDLFRIVLGAGWGISLVEMWLRPWWPDKIVIILGIISFWLVFIRIRRSRLRKRTSLCNACPQKTDTPCDGFKQQIDAEKRFNREVDSFLRGNSMTKLHTS